MRVTSKGQVTIPEPIRRSAGLLPGTEVEFVHDGDVVAIRPTPPGRRKGKSRGERIVETLRGTATRDLGMSTDEIMKLLRGDD